jgi:hypothetical protein
MTPQVMCAIVSQAKAPDRALAGLIPFALEKQSN